MLKKTILGAVLILLVFFTETGMVDAGEYKLSVFNFGTLNIEASGLGTSVTNTLISTLKTEPSISILDRKDLETFLNLNDLQQNDQLDNVVNIGSRLGLDFIVVGSVSKRGSSIVVNCSLIQIDRRKEVYSTRVRALGESALAAEVGKLGALLISVLTKDNPAGGAASDAEGASTVKSPVNFQKFPGNKKITLRWQIIPGFAAAGYEVYRGLDQNGPFAMLGQTDKTEYQDQNVEINTEYYYKVRAYDKLSRFSDFTSVLSARTDFAPNPPIIMKTEGRSKNILIVWAPHPLKSQDTSRLTGYKIYRSENENGSYQEVNKLSLSDLTGNEDGKIYYRATALPDGQTFFYRLAAFNEKGIESELCQPVKGTTIPAIASVKSVSHLIREVRLSWAAIASPFAVAYNVYRSSKSDGGFVKIKRIKASETLTLYDYSDVEGLGDNLQYYYFITVEDDLGGETSPSKTVMAVTRDVPPQPEKFTARSDMVKKVELTWQAVEQEEVEGYNIYWSLIKDGRYQLLKKISGRENCRYLDESRGFEPLEDGRTYFYMLTAYNKVDAQSKQATANATTKSKPKRPENVQGKYEAGKAILSWLPNQETDISHYIVYEKTFTGMGKIAQVPSAGYSDSSIASGKNKIYMVSAVNRSGLESEVSAEITVSARE
jgi:uncharacterized protein